MKTNPHWTIKLILDMSFAAAKWFYIIEKLGARWLVKNISQNISFVAPVNQ